MKGILLAALTLATIITGTLGMTTSLLHLFMSQS